MKKYNLINNVIGWICFAIAALTYLLTLEPTASFWDCPEFISQGAKLEVGHPPGNPIFMLTARFFVTLFGGSMSTAAIAVNSMSALLSAGTILLLFWTITHLVRRLIVRDNATDISLRKTIVIMAAGVCGALAYTWSDTFWFSAVEGEVYAFSSFCTALVFWLILKWENRADMPHSDRYLVLIAYVIGVSVAVHLLNLLCIPAIVLVFYYRKYRNITAKGSLAALAVSCVIVAAILYGLVPGFVKVAQYFELFFVNTIGMSYNMGVLIYAIVLTGVFTWCIFTLNAQRSAAAVKISFALTVALSGLPFIGNGWIAFILLAALVAYLFIFCPKVPVRIFNVIALSIFVIFVGYSSYALLLIRANAATPMNQNAPDNVFSLASYLNREQYGERPLFYGPVFVEQLVTEEYPVGSGQYYAIVDDYGRPKTQVLDNYMRDENGNPYNTPVSTYTKVVKTDPSQPDQYVQEVSRPGYKTLPDVNMLFTRIYSTDQNSGHPQQYKSWAEYRTPDIDNIPSEVRAKWAEQGIVPIYELAPYLTHQTTIHTAYDAMGNPVESTSAWKPGFGANMRYFLNYQLNHMYWRYFMWNFAGRQNDIQGNGEPYLGNWISGIPAIDNARLGDQSMLPDEYGKGNKGHNVFYMLPLLLGLFGLLWQALARQKYNPDRGIEQFWVVFFLFFMTGIAIVLYLNQTPGQPRERDYAFAGSFYAFSIWIGLGVPAIAATLRKLFERKKGKDGNIIPAGESAKWACTAMAAVIAVAVPLQMVSQTWDDHNRAGRYTTRDFGRNYLASVDKNAIIFCNGDNDTFPLWYAQEVDGYRTDVRVVNLSYLTTDWYANQLKHPYYEAQAVPTYATPTDYGYERMGWNFVIPSDTIVDAETALRELYASDARRFGAPYMLHSYVRIPIDTAATISYFNIDPAGPDSTDVLPYMQPIETDLSKLGQGMSLNRALALDIVANNVASGWKRPTYIASTVPSSYYLGMMPYMSATGMTYQFTPFLNAPVSPVAEKAYANIMGEFAWGGLDVPGAEKIYLDETVRRMIASTRSAVYTVAEDLLASGSRPASQWAIDHAKATGAPIPATRYDMARNIIDLLDTKLPGRLSPYDSMLGIYMAGMYYDLYQQSHDTADLDKAEALIDAELPRYAQWIRYLSSLAPADLARVSRIDLYGVQYLGTAIALKNRIALVRALDGNEIDASYAAMLKKRPGIEYDMRIAPLIYLDGIDFNDLSEQAANYSGSQRAIIDEALLLLGAHNAAGVDPMTITDSIIKDYGLDQQRWLSLINY